MYYFDHALVNLLTDLRVVRLRHRAVSTERLLSLPNAVSSDPLLLRRFRRPILFGFEMKPVLASVDCHLQFLSL